ncbi:MAG: hypothetical protein LUG86_09015 [Oscillospiraceae bacterium]|nr:hypothetical protein [Oscillospiraceae bacterium]
MVKIFKLNGEGVLNFIDLRRRFSVWEIYKERSTFIEFAKVHCLPLPSLYHKPEDLDEQTAEDVDGKVTLKYLDKQFWLDLLITADELSGFSDATSALEKFKDSELAFEKNTAMIAAEYSSLKLGSKLAHIKESGHFSDSENDIKTMLSLLAICEISEMDALEVSFEHQEQSEEETEEEIRLISGSGGTLYLKTREKPYRFWYYSSDTLMEQDKIATMRIEARSGGNRYESVKLELYSDADGSLVQCFDLSEKEYRYCNVTAGRIIKFLPSVSISDDLALIRENYAKSEISVLSPDADKWTLNEDFSCFAAGSGENGFIGVSYGRVNASYYRALKDYMSKLKLDMVMIPVVEVRIGENGYELLTEEGSVVTEKDPKAAKSRIVSLSPRSAPVNSKVTKDSCEVAVSLSGNSEIRHYGSAQRCSIHFGG